MKYRVLVPCYRGKYKPGDILPDDFVVDRTWIESGIVEEVSEPKRIVKNKRKNEEIDHE